MDPWIKSFAQRLNSPGGHIEVRMGGGWPRLINNLSISGDWPIDDLQASQLEIKHGLGAGQLGRRGFPYLFDLLQKLKPVNGVAENDKNKFLFAIKPGLQENSFIAKNMFLQDAAIADGNRRCVVNGQIASLRSLLRNRSVVYTGAARTLKFIDQIGIPRENAVVIPDSSAVLSYDAIYKQVSLLIEQLSNGPVDNKIVFAHSSASFGLTLMLDLGRKVAFTSLDLGLAAAIYDTEYMASRPWFVENQTAIFRTRLALENGFDSPDKTDAPSPDVSAFGALWRQAVRSYESDPLNAMSLLEEAIKHVPLEEAPIARATLEYWRCLHRRSYSLRNCFDICKSCDKHEPDVLTAVVLWLSGASQSIVNERMLQALEKGPHDPVTPKVQQALIYPPGARTIPYVRKLLTMERRDYDGSRLNWSLLGDFPRSISHSPLNAFKRPRRQ